MAERLGKDPHDIPLSKAAGRTCPALQYKGIISPSTARRKGGNVQRLFPVFPET